jgi:hypothetical protein
VEDDEDIDHMEIPHTPKRNSKRVYQPTLEVREQISRTLKALEKRTGAISRRVQKQHQDPEMHARMVDAMKASSLSLTYTELLTDFIVVCSNIIGICCCQIISQLLSVDM